jgi:hypothetical protein
MEMFNQILSMFGAVNASLQNLQTSATSNSLALTQGSKETDMMMQEGQASHNTAITQWHTNEPISNQQTTTNQETSIGSGDQTNSQNHQLTYSPQLNKVKRGGRQWGSLIF